MNGPKRSVRISLCTFRSLAGRGLLRNCSRTWLRFSLSQKMDWTGPCMMSNIGGSAHLPRRHFLGRLSTKHFITKLCARGLSLWCPPPPPGLLLSVLPTPTWVALQAVRIFATKLVASQQGSALHSTVLANIAVSPLAPTSTHASSAKEENLTLSSCVKSKTTDKGNLPTPINHECLAELLLGYDTSLANTLLNGFRSGFTLHCEKGAENIELKNHQSVDQNSDVTKELIEKELREGRYGGPFSDKPFPKFQISPLKLHPKKEQGKFRLIHNLSAPYDEKSINENICNENTSVQYASIQDAITIIQQLGPHCYMAKSDIKSAYRLIPVSPADYPKLGLKFDGFYYFDKCLAQGCASSCKTFEMFSTALEWILKRKYGVKYCLHVLDDFLFLGKSYEECAKYLFAWESLCKVLSVPLAPGKTMGPSTNIIFLGIELCSENMLAKLPPDKLSSYHDKLTALMGKRKTTLQDMQSVVGCLQFATSVILPGKAFVRRLVNTTLGVKKPFHFVTLNEEARSDIRMWFIFFKCHNGKTMFLSPVRESSISLNLYSDACKKACSATFQSCWFVIKFPVSWQERNIAFLEFYPIVIALQIFGVQLSNRNIVFHCDNKAIVDVINKQSCKNVELMKLMRYMVLTAMQYNIKFTAMHVPGKDNILADALSRLQVSPHLLAIFGMNGSPVPVPAHLQPHNFKPIWVLY